MIGAALLLAMQVAHPAEAPPPANWAALPELHYRHRPDIGPELSGFVRDEVRAGRCTATHGADGSDAVTVELAVLAAPAGPVRRIVPRAIGCPTVEQYATGLVERMARDNLDLDGEPAQAWYRTVLAFVWKP